MTASIWIANILGWPVIHLVTAWITLRMPLDRFERNGFLVHSRAWERDGAFYRDRLAIHRWKSRLPDGAPWLGGFSKGRVASRNPAYLHQFLLEAKRAEIAHWWMLFCLPVFFLWNPLWACLVMTGYAFAANLPCILAQRYNRLVLARLLERLQQRSKA
jgi:glycosyl-4,4'-diaponeurosporenoate acyltransferase